MSMDNDGHRQRFRRRPPVTSRAIAVTAKEVECGEGAIGFEPRVQPENRRIHGQRQSGQIDCIGTVQRVQQDGDCSLIYCIELRVANVHHWQS